MKTRTVIGLCLALALSAGRLAAQNSQDSTLSAKDIKFLKSFKLGGFLQYRYEYDDTSKSAGAGFVTGTANPNDNNFYVRRGRVKFTYQPNASSDYVFQFDGAKNTFVVKDAFIDLYHKFGQQKFALTAGQFNIPFGFEIEEADTKNDFLERSTAEGKLFNGERDRGVNLTYNAPKYIQINVGLLQGYGIQDNTFTWFDPTKSKDFVGRVKASLGKLNIGFSTYFGHTFAPGNPAVAAVPSITTWYDVNGDGVVDAGDSIKTTPGKAAKAATPGTEYQKNRVGMDAQLDLHLIPVGATGIKGEFYGARDKGLTEQGWYVRLSQALGKKFAGAVRYDFWDPNTNDGPVDRAIGTYGFVAWYAFDANIRLTLAYDIPQLLKGSSTFSKSSNDIEDNKLSLQFQYAL